MTIDQLEDNQGQGDLTDLVGPALLQGVALAARPLEDLLPLVCRHSSSSSCFFDRTSSRLEGLALTDPLFSFGLRLFFVRFVQNLLLVFLDCVQYISLFQSSLLLMKLI